MNSVWWRMVCRLLIVCMVAFPYSAHSSMVTTPELVAASGAQANRDKVRDFVSRSDVQRQMETMGLDSANAKQRVDAMTDDEIRQIAGRIDQLPAGADGGDFVAIVAIVAIVILVMFYWKR